MSMNVVVKLLAVFVVIFFIVISIYPAFADNSKRKLHSPAYVEQPGDTWYTNSPPRKKKRQRASKAEKTPPAPHMVVVPKPEHHANLKPYVPRTPDMPIPKVVPEKKESKNPFVVLGEALGFIGRSKRYG